MIDLHTHSTFSDGSFTPEQLAVEAAVHGNRDTALFALLAHPLVADYDIAKDLLCELLEVNSKYLPQFK